MDSDGEDGVREGSEDPFIVDQAYDGELNITIFLKDG
jgi:hypothetical protein